MIPCPVILRRRLIAKSSGERKDRPYVRLLLQILYTNEIEAVFLSVS